VRPRAVFRLMTLELGGLLNGEVGGFRTPEDFVHVSRRAWHEASRLGP
jgi:hypothetical protein